MFSNDQIMEIALRQSAYDCNCSPDDFLKEHYIITESVANPKARKYLPLPFACDFVSYGNNVVAQTNDVLRPIADKYLSHVPPEHAFETPNLLALEDLIRPLGYRICFMAEYFLPDVQLLKLQTCPYELRLLHPHDFAALYLPQWSNALCRKRKELDVLGVGAYDGEKLVGLAGCSADCEDLYQIGVDVLPEYRRQGIASAITSALAIEILKLGKVPFYCAAWCNIKSVKNAMKCGFRPAWVSLTVREESYVEEINADLK